MTDLEELNRAINRTLRALNGIAIRAPLSGLKDSKAALREITEAVAHLDALQRMVVASDEGLEYHFDPRRPPTRSMKEIADLVESAEDHVRRGKILAAEDMLRRAQEKEPPPLVYEAIAKRLDSIRGNQQRD